MFNVERLLNAQHIPFYGEPMVDESSLSPNGKKVYDAIKKLGAVTEDKMKTADDIMKASGLGKALATAALQDLTNKGFVKRVVRQKSAGYFAIK